MSFLSGLYWNLDIYAVKFEKYGLLFSFLSCSFSSLATLLSSPLSIAHNVFLSHNLPPSRYCLSIRLTWKFLTFFFNVLFFFNIFKWVVYYFINLWFFNCAHYSRIQKPMLCLVLLLSYFLSLANFLVFLISSVAGDRALSVLGLVLWVDILLF